MSLTPVQLTHHLLGRHCLVGGTALCRVFFLFTAITTTQNLSKYSPAHAFGLIASTLNLADGLGVWSHITSKDCVFSWRQQAIGKLDTAISVLYTFCSVTQRTQ